VKGGPRVVGASNKARHQQRCHTMTVSSRTHQVNENQTLIFLAAFVTLSERKAKMLIRVAGACGMDVGRGGEG
jgi:hypothetical protein